MRLLPLALVSLLALPARAFSPEELTALDALYARRDEAAAAQALEDRLGRALEAAPEDFELLWRASRLRQWQAVGAGEKARRLLGKQAWELGDRARQANPARVEGPYFAALGLGLYAQAVGVLTALGEGLEARFIERLDAAIRINPMYERGGPLLVKGRYYYELPCPKRDLKKSAALLRQVLSQHPERLRARLYLAETLLEEGRAEEAREVFFPMTGAREVADPPEGLRVQASARQVRTRIEAALE